MSFLTQLKDERAAHDEHRTACKWAIGFMEQYKKEHFAQIEALRQRFMTAHQMQEEKLRRMNIEFDEELYPHLVSAVAERR